MTKNNKPKIDKEALVKSKKQKVKVISNQKIVRK